MMVMAWWNLIVLMITNQAVLILADRCFDLFSPGYIAPYNDIYLSAGDSLRLNCTLNIVNNTHNAQNIVWTTDSNKSLNPFQRVVSNSTSKLVIDNATIHDSAGYSCKLKTHDSDRKINICSVSVKVGYAPPKNAAINCEVLAWRLMNCTWKQPKNPIAIDWVFQINRNNRKMNCKYYFDSNQGCMFNDSTFRALPCVIIFLNGTNKLQSNVITQWEFPMDQHVILDKPDKLSVPDVTERNAKIEWDVFSKNILDLICEVRYHCEWKIDQCKEKIARVKIAARRKVACKSVCSNSGMEDCKSPVDKPQNVSFEMHGAYELHELIPSTQYVVNVRCQIASTVFPLKWSKMANKTFETKPAVPIMKPDIVVEDIEKDTTTGNVNLIVYWKEIPAYLRYGTKFWYKVMNGNDAWLSNTSVVTIKNLTVENQHNFTITSCNEIGCANTSTRIVVPRNDTSSDLLQVYAVQYYPNNAFEVTWRIMTAYVATNHFIILKCVVQNIESSPKAVAGEPCNIPLEVIRANTTAVHKVNVSRHLSNSLSVLTSYSVYSMNLTFDPPDSGYKYKYAVAVRNQTFSSGLVSVSCTVIKAHQQLKIDSTKEGTTWAEIKWEVPNGCLTKDTVGYDVVYWTNSEKFTISLDDPFATVVNLTGLSPNTIYEGQLITKKLQSSLESTATFNFVTKDVVGPSSSSQNVIVGLSVIGGIIFVGIMIILAIYLVKKVKATVKELKNIQIPSGLREDSHVVYRPPHLSKEPSNLPLTKFDSPLLTHVPSSPPAFEKITNGSNSSGFGSDFHDSTTSSPTTSFSSSNHMSRDCCMDPDTPSIILVSDSVFEYPFDPVTNYSLVGKSVVSNDVQVLDPSALDDGESIVAELMDETLTYAKVALPLVRPVEDVDRLSDAVLQPRGDELGSSPYNKGYMTLAAADLTLQPYVQVALDTDATRPNASREHKEPEAAVSMDYVSVGMNNNNGVNSLLEEQVIAAGGSGLGYVSCTFLDDPTSQSHTLSDDDTLMESILNDNSDNVDDEDDDDSMISFDGDVLGGMNHIIG